MQIDGIDHLRTWLTTNLQNVCDADPDVLTKYILALLKKDKPEAEMKEFCIDQLDVFLQKETNRFVEKLFSVMRDKSYLPADQRPKATLSAPKKEKEASSEPAKPPATESRSIKLSSSETRKKDREAASSKSAEASKTSERRSTRQTANAVEPKKEPEAKASSAHRRMITVSVPAESAEMNGSSRREVREPRVVRRSRSKSPRERTGISRRLGARAVGHRVTSPAARRTEREVRDATSDARRVLRPRERSRTRSRSPRERREKGRDKPAASVELEEEKVEKRSRCRDYDEKGYCMRGDRCPYDHGPDPVVVEDPEYIPKMISLHPDTPAQAPTSSMPNLSVPPPGYNALNPPPPGVDTIYTSNNTVASDGYNPEKPQLSDTAAQQQQQSHPPTSTAAPAPNLMVPPPGYPAMQPGPVMWQAPPPGYASLPPPTSQPSGGMLGKRPYDGEHSGHQGQWFPKRGRGRGMGGRGGGPGRFGAGNLKPDVPEADKSIVVRKIPVVQNTIFLLSKHFGRFGDIKNVQVGYEGDAEAALITYAQPNQATAAFKSKAPILNNRFIRVFFYGDTDQSRPGGAGQPSGAEHHKAVPGMAAAQSRGGAHNAAAALSARNKPAGVGAAKAPTVVSRALSQENYVALRKRRKLLNQKKTAYLDLYKKKRQMLEKTLAEQKTLFAGLDKAKNNAQKKEYSKMIKIIDKQATTLKAELADITKKMKALTAASAAAEKAGKPVRTKQQIVKETVDLELEMMSLKQAGKDTQIHEKKLEKLKEELATAPDESEVAKPEPVTPTRALGQAAQRLLRRSSSSGKSRAAQLIPASANLDKRPRNVMVVGFLNTERDALTKHMTQFGELEDFELDKDKEGIPRAIVTYKTRKDAEQAVALAADFEGRHISVQWCAQATAAAAESSGSASTAHADASNESVVVPDAAREPSEQMSATQLLASIADDDDDNSSEVDSTGDDDVLLQDDELVHDDPEPEPQP